MWAQLDITELHIMLVNIREFRENRRLGAHMKLGMRVRRGRNPRIAPPAVSLADPRCKILAPTLRTMS